MASTSRSGRSVQCQSFQRATRTIISRLAASNSRPASFSVAVNRMHTMARGRIASNQPSIKGIPLEARVQPLIEGWLLAILPLAMVCILFTATEKLAGLLLLASSLLIIARVARWKLWHCTDRPDLLVLAIGYLWLAAGAAVTGVHLVAGHALLPALHVIAVGA